jgi:hypothetical protein
MEGSMEQKLPILLCKSSSTHTQHLTLQQYFFTSKISYLLIDCFQNPTHTHEIGIVNGQNSLIANHLDQSIYLTVTIAGCE